MSIGQLNWSKYPAQERSLSRCLFVSEKVELSTITKGPFVSSDLQHEKDNSHGYEAGNWQFPLATEVGNDAPDNWYFCIGSLKLHPVMHVNVDNLPSVCQ